MNAVSTGQGKPSDQIRMIVFPAASKSLCNKSLNSFGTATSRVERH